MAGATAEILLPGLPEDVLASWEATVAALSTSREGNEFWVRPLEEPHGMLLPFFWALTDDLAEGWIFQGEPDAVMTVRDTFGFTPTTSILFGALCRGRSSDEILAHLSASFLTGREGVLLFHGLLAPSIEYEAWRSWHALTPDDQATKFVQDLGPFTGRIVALPIGGEPSYHAVDLPFLRFWRGHRAFRFVN